jgi:hypothetical protein
VATNDSVFATRRYSFCRESCEKMRANDVNQSAGECFRTFSRWQSDSANALSEIELPEAFEGRAVGWCMTFGHSV